jgi:hypothetical protein
MSRDKTREFLVDAAFRAVAEASLTDLLAFLSPKTIAERARELMETDARSDDRAPSAPTVAYHFHVAGTSRKFDRQTLVDTLIDRACEQVADAARSAAEEYLRAADALAAGHDLDSVYQAVEHDIDMYRPGLVDRSVDARERLFFTAMATCDDGGHAAERLRETDARVETIFVGVYERFLMLTGRRVVSGYTTRELAILVSMLLNGEAMRYRYGNSLRASQVTRAIMRIFWAFTTRNGLPDPDVEGDLLANL